MASALLLKVERYMGEVADSSNVGSVGEMGEGNTGEQSSDSEELRARSLAKETWGSLT
jgi:hypothetical protein